MGFSGVPFDKQDKGANCTCVRAVVLRSARN